MQKCNLIIVVDAALFSPPSNQEIASVLHLETLAARIEKKKIINTKSEKHISSCSMNLEKSCRRSSKLKCLCELFIFVKIESAAEKKIFSRKISWHEKLIT